MPPCGVVHGADILRQHLRRGLPVKPKTVHETVRGLIASLAVAASGGLQQRIKPALFAVGDGEVHIDARFYKRR